MMAIALQLAAETRAWKALRTYATAEDEGKKEKAYQSFRDARQYVTPEAKDELDQALAEIDTAGVEAALAAYAAAAARTKALKRDFDLGTEVAETETKELFFPAAASYLGQAADLLDQIKKAAETVKNEIDSLEGGLEKKDLTGLIENAKSVMASAEKIKGVFEDLKESLPGEDKEEG